VEISHSAYLHVPALEPPPVLQTRATFSASKSTILPFPSSPHWEPKMTRALLDMVYVYGRSTTRNDERAVPKPPEEFLYLFAGRGILKEKLDRTKATFFFESQS
jgi:hypothetical protein